MITDDFEAIASDDQVQAFVEKYGFKTCQIAESAWNLGEWTGRVGTDSVHLGFRWYDPSGPFNIQPDIHVAKLPVKGQGARAVYQKELKYPEKF